ncbi:MAG: thiamine-phosphate kinase [Thiotrichales bacterium]|nr:thiamine-phosphate kinase [Thiotrichales bacterium]
MREEAEHVAVALDTLVGGVHFPADTPAYDVGYKALAVNLSDLAAMGAVPTEAVAVVSMPEPLGPPWLAEFRAGLASLADSLGVAPGVVVAAVDAVPGALSVSVEVQGRCPAGKALTRVGARAGDRIFVSGTLGDAGGGLEIALGRRPERPGASARALVARLRRPEPRLALGVALRGIAGSAIDVSDGLCQDLNHILTASGVGARVDASRVPLSPALREVMGDGGARSLALSAGDDYELLFTVAPERVGRLGTLKLADASLRHDFSSVTEAGVIEPEPGLRLTEIGVIEPEPGLRLEDAAGTAIPVPAGYRHFPTQ